MTRCGQSEARPSCPKTRRYAHGASPTPCRNMSQRTINRLSLFHSQPWMRMAWGWIGCLLLVWDPHPCLGQAGALDTNYHPMLSYYVNALAVQPDGKALVGGGFRLVEGLERHALARLNPDGTVDPGFAPALGEVPEVNTVLLQPDGKIVVGGRSLQVETNNWASIVRMETNGTMDPTFRSALSSFSSLNALALQTDGKILAASDDSVDRLETNGSRDTNFTPLQAFQWVSVPGGTVSANSTFRCLVQLPDSRILLGGSIQAIDGTAVGAGLVRLNGDGSWDRTFQSFTNWAVSALVVQPDGRIVIGRNGGLARLMPDGAWDSTFALPIVEGDVSSLILQQDGRILVAGYFERVTGLLRRGVARMNPDGTLDRDFDPGNLGGFALTSAALQADQAVLVGGYFTPLNSGPSYLARLHNDNTNSPGRFEFLSLSNSVPESAGQMAIPVCRYGGSAGTVSVVAATRWGSALPGSDYMETTQTLVFPPGLTTNYLSVKIVSDALVEGPYGWEAFQVDLSFPTGGATLGSERQTTAYILEDGVAIGFQNDVDAAQEADGMATIRVFRFGLTNAMVSASYSCQDGTAKSPSDYTSQSGKVTFAPGVTNALISIPLNDDLLVEGDETFTIRLRSPTGGASLAISNLTVHITDDVSLVALGSDRTVTEKDGQLVLPVSRWGRTNNTVSVDYSTKDLTAQSGTDYVASTGTLTFLPGQTEQSITVSILDDDVPEDLEQFQVGISHPAGALVIPYGDTRTITVISDDGAGYPDVLFTAAVPGNRVNQLELCPGDRILIRGDGSPTNGTWLPTLVRYLPDGSVDTSFRHSLTDEILAMAVDAQGRIYVGNGLGLSSRIIRLAADGSEDRSFDPFYLDSTVPGPMLHPAMAVQPDGKVLIGAVQQFQCGYETTTNALNRLNEDGSYDLTFQPDYHFGGDTLAAAPYAITVQPNGRILIGATLQSTNGALRECVLRLTREGQIDGSFSPISELNRRAQGIRLLANENILLNGSFTVVNGRPRLGLAVLHPDGSLDSDFTPAFQALDYFLNSVAAAAIQADGKILFCGDVRVQGGPELALARLNPDGSLDPSFRPAAAFPNYLWHLALQSDGGILLGGTSGPFFGRALERLHNDPQAAGGAIEFSSASIVTKETNKTVSIALHRKGATHGTVRVAYSTASGSALPGHDFQTQSGVLEFPDGDATEKLITLSILDDALVEEEEVFFIHVAPPLGGAVWGKNAATRIVIQDDDIARPPSLHISRGTENQWKLHFLGSPGAHYSLWSSSDLKQWEDSGFATEVAPGSFEFSDFSSPGQTSRFYRVRWH